MPIERNGSPVDFCLDKDDKNMKQGIQTTAHFFSYQWAGMQRQTPSRDLQSESRATDSSGKVIMCLHSKSLCLAFLVTQVLSNVQPGKLWED